MGYYDPARLQAMREYYEKGHTLKEVGAKFYCQPETVYLTFKKYGVPRRSYSNSVRRGCRNPERLKQMVAMRESGLTFREIGEHFDVTPPAVIHLFRTYHHETAQKRKGRR